MNKIKRLPALWSILPDELAKLKHEYHALIINDRKTPEEIKALEAQDALLADFPDQFFMSGSIAIMRIEGVIFPKSDFFSWLFGGSTLDVMARDFNRLINDDSIAAIILEIDSPGGVVSGVQEFANLVFEGRKRKPIFAISASIMTSAAYWIAAAADEVIITDDNVMTGSIGVVIEHIDVSELERKFGIKTTEITAGKYKRIASSVKPLSEEGREVLQNQVDHVYGAFTRDIAKFRSVDINTVLEEMADGKTFIGSQGNDVGLVDDMLIIDDLVEQAEQANNSNIQTKEVFDMPATKILREMTADMIAEKHPKAYDEIYSNGIEAARALAKDDIEEAKLEGVEVGREKGHKEGEIVGRQEERERIKAVQDQTMPGHETLIATLMYDGTTTGAQAAVKVLQAEKEGRAKKLVKLETEAIKPVENQAEIDAKKKEGKSLKEVYEGSQELQDEFKSLGAYEAYEKNLAAGNVKVFTRAANKPR